MISKYLRAFTVFLFLLGAGVYEFSINAKVHAGGIMAIEYINSAIEEKPCQVYFFESWSTYTHPVKPIKPLYFEQAILLKAYYRAWLCQTGPETKQFVLFENVVNQLKETDISKSHIKKESPVSLYAVIEDDGSILAGEEIELKDSLMSGNYLVSVSDGKQNLILINQVIHKSFRYLYRSDGSLQNATVTNSEGKVSEFAY